VPERSSWELGYLSFATTMYFNGRRGSETFGPYLLVRMWESRCAVGC